MTSLHNDDDLRPTYFWQKLSSTDCSYGAVAAMAKNGRASLCIVHHHSFHVVETLVQCLSRIIGGIRKISEYAHFE